MKKVILLVLSLFISNISAVEKSPLYIAAELGDIQKIEEYVNAAADLDQPNRAEATYTGWDAQWDDKYVNLSPIYGAIYGKKVAAIDFLLKKGAQLNDAPGNYYWHRSPLEAAAATSAEIFYKLLQNGAYVGFEAGLKILITTNIKIDLLEKILEYRKTIASNQSNKDILSELLSTAARALQPINLEIFNLLIKLGANVNYITYLSFFEKTEGTLLHVIANHNGFMTTHYEGYDSRSREVIIQNKIDMINILVKNGAVSQLDAKTKKRPFELARVPQILEALKSL